MAENILGGTGQPKIKFKDGTTYTLPFPNGTGRTGIEHAGFEANTLDEYRSEGDMLVEVGKKFKFLANMSWETAHKEVLNKLFKAWADSSFTFWPHEDDDKVKFICRIPKNGLVWDYSQGMVNGILAYTIKLQIEGIEFLDAPYIGDYAVSGGYGSTYGTGYGSGL